MPKFSILIPTYNQAKYIPAALDSLLDQGFVDWEAVVVNDGSTDNTAQVLEDYAARDQRIRVFSKENGGTVSALNEGLKHIQGEWVFWLSSDDWFEADKLQVHADEIAANPGRMFFFTHCYYFDDSTNSKIEPEINIPAPELRVIAFFVSNFVNGITVCIHRTVFEQLGGFDPSIRYAHDVEMWLRICAHYDACYINRRLSVSRLHNERATITSENASVYDYAWFLGEFLNRYRFERLFRLLDLSIYENAVFALHNTFRVSADASAMLYKSGYNGALLERLAEWLTTDCNPSLRKQLIKLTNQLIQVVVESDLPTEIKQLHIALSHNIKQAYCYQPHDVYTEAGRFVREKTGKGEDVRILANHLQAVVGNEISNTSEPVTVASDRDNQTSPADSGFVNIGMVTYNRLEFTQQAIEALVKFTEYPHVLTIVDNNSQDGTRDYLIRQQQLGVIKNLILLDENVGVAKAANIAWLQEPDAAYFLKLDNDIVVQKHGWLNAMVDTLERVQELGVVAYNFEPVSYPRFKVNGVIFRMKDDKGSGTLGGACVLIPKRTQKLLGYWNEEYGLYGEEDADYGVRVATARLRNAYMEDEDIGLHLPAGKAAAIDLDTLVADDAAELEMHRQYREWKDEQRRENVQQGLFHRNILAYINHEKSLYVEAGELAVQKQAEKNAGPPALSDEQSLKIAVYSLDHPATACPHLRLLQPMETLADRIEYRWVLDVDANGKYSLDKQAHEWADLIIVQRFMPGKETQHVMDMLIKSGKPLIYEADDLFVGEPPEHSQFVEAFRQQRPYIEALLGKVDAVTTSTQALARKYGEFCDNVTVLPNLIDLAKWQKPDQSAAKDQRLTIAYAGTPTHLQDLALIEGALERISQKYGSNIRFLFMGCYTERISRLPGFECVKFEFGYDAYVNQIRQQHIDIILSPLVDNEFNRCKSNIKWLEFSVLGLPGIYSDLEPYQKDVIHGETGLLCENTEQAWLCAIEQLISQPELRARIAQQARQRVIQDYAAGTASDQFYQTWQDVYASHGHLGPACRTAGAGLNQQDGSEQVEAEDDPQHFVSGPEQKQAYYESWMRQHSVSEGGIQILAERMHREWKIKPYIRLIVRIEQGQQNELAGLLDNLGKQFYNNWALTVISELPCPDQVFHQADMLEWRQFNGDYHQALNEMMASVKEDWSALLQVGDRLEPNLLLVCGDYINLHPEWVVMYCDEDELNRNEERCKPRFKPDFNLDLLRSTDYAGWFTLARTEAINCAGGMGSYPGFENHDLLFRLFENYGARTIGHIDDVLYHVHYDDIRDEHILQQVVRDHLERSGVQAEVGQGFLPGTCRVVYQHDQTPMVSIIVPTRNKLEFIQPCVDSVLERTDYPNYEVLIVDNNSDDPDVFEYYDELIKHYPDKLRVLKYPDNFNYAAICNLAAREARGEYLLQLNNDTEIIQDAWLSRMMQHGQREEVAIVGTRLVFPGTGKIQHAGIVMGMDSIADHPYCNLLDLTDPGYMGRAQVDQNYSAVTGACLLTRTSVYQELGGMDENHLKVSYNDVDLCLKANEAGYLVVWTPYVTLVHHGSVSQKTEFKDPVVSAEQIIRFREEQQTMFERWSPVIARDPAYNRHLSLTDRDFRVEKNIVINWDVNFHDRTRILGVPLHGGSGEYRVIAPLRALDREALAEADVTYSEAYDSQRIPTTSELLRTRADSLLLNAPITDAHLHAVKHYRKFNDAFMVYSLDDLITRIPRESPVWKKIPADVRSRIREGLYYCDRMIVSTDPIAQLCRNMIDDIRVVPNMLEMVIWGEHQSRRSVSHKPRVGWAGAMQHGGDLRIIEDVVKQLAGQVEWVFFGMCPDNLKPYVAEQHDFVMSFYDYPEKLASLNLDLALAPLDVNPFNEAKSNLRLLEYGMLGWPVVCTDILPYQDAPVCRVENSTAAWVDAIQARINDLDAAYQEGDRLRQWVLDNHILENNLDIWLDALTREQLSGSRSQMSDFKGLKSAI